VKYGVVNFFGLQRSGNHAVLNWLLGLDEENSLFFNNIQIEQDIRTSSVAVSVPAGVKAYKQRVDGKLLINEHYINDFKNNGGTVVCSFENQNLDFYNQIKINQLTENYFGKALKIKNIILIRNPFSMIQSTANVLRKWQGENDEKWFVKELVKRLELWNVYAKHFLDNENDFTKVVFDDWVVSKDYRDSLATQLGYVNEDKNLDFVSDAGTGSSFSGKRLNDKLGVLNRWGDSDDHEVIMTLFRQHGEKTVNLFTRLFPKSKIPNEVYQHS
jgi:hypothetical protein